MIVPTSMETRLKQEWEGLLRTWSVRSALVNPAFDDISVRYGEPHRFYHTLTHIQNVLATVESMSSLAKDIRTVKLAAWLHDVIYDSKASDNEDRSANYAQALCSRLAIPAGAEVASLI